MNVVKIPFFLCPRRKEGFTQITLTKITTVVRDERIFTIYDIVCFIHTFTFKVKDRKYV